MLWRSRNCCGMRLSRITYPKCLNESPRPKAGKYRQATRVLIGFHTASMKVPARRQGNRTVTHKDWDNLEASMKVPTRLQGNDASFNGNRNGDPASMKVPDRRRGNRNDAQRQEQHTQASMKVPTRRRGNTVTRLISWPGWTASMKVPTQRRGNHRRLQARHDRRHPASMKVPARRWGNHLVCSRIIDVFSLNESPHPKAGKLVEAPQ